MTRIRLGLFSKKSNTLSVFIGENPVIVANFITLLFY